MLYRVVADHLETFLARIHADETRAGLPAFVERELRAYLRCGILAHGFARFRCASCRTDLLVAFACKKRGFCPACGGRRMSDTAAWLVDRVLPEAPVRQWVLSLPFELRPLLAHDPALCAAVRRLFVRAVTSWIERRARDAGTPDGRTGAVVFVQRFDSALRLNVHFHVLFLDGVFTAEGEQAPPVFHATEPPTTADVAGLLRTIARRTIRLLRRTGKLDDLGGLDPGLDEPGCLDTCYAAAAQGKIPFGPHTGAITPRVGDAPITETSRAAAARCATLAGFSLHADVHIPAHARKRLEKLCRYAARPPIAQERLSLTRDGHVLYRFKRPHKDGRTHVLLDPLTFISRLVALIPRPRAHLVTYHGVLAPAAALRSRIVPPPPTEPDLCPDPRRKRRASPTPSAKPPRRTTLPWAELLRRVFYLEVLRCPCGGTRRFVALIRDPAVVARILEHLDLVVEPPAIAHARPPPEPVLPFSFA